MRPKQNSYQWMIGSDVDDLGKWSEVGDAFRIFGANQIQAFVSGEAIDQISSIKRICFHDGLLIEVFHQMRMASSMESQ
jgi:hypothetical protein